MQTDRLLRLIRIPSVKKAAAAVFILFLLYSIAGFFILPPVVRSVLKKRLSQQFHREVEIQHVSLNPLTLSATLQGVSIKERGSAENFLSVERLYINFQAVSIIKRALVIKELKFTGPYLNIRRDADGIYNFSDLLASKPGAGKNSAASAGLKFSVNNIQIINGSADFFDGVKNVRHTLRAVNLTIPFISNIAYYADVYVKPSFTALINNEQVSFEGETKLFANSLQTIIKLNIKNLDLTHYLSYVPFKMKFKIPSGYLNMDTVISYVQYKNRPPLLDISGGIALKNLKLEDANGNQVMNLPLLDTSIISTDLFSKAIHVSDLVLTSPEFDIVRNPNGTINILELLPKTNAQPELKGPRPLPLISSDSIAIKEGKLVFTDLSLSKKFTTRIDGLNMNVSHFTTAAGKKSALELAFKTEADESLGIKSDFSISPVTADGSFEVKNIVLKKYAPYYRKIVRFDIEDGKLGLASGFSYDGDVKHGVENITGMSINVSDLKLRKEGDKRDFLSVPVLAVNGVDIDLLNRKVGVAGIKTEKGALWASRQKNGTMDLTGLMAAVPKARSGAEKKKKGQSQTQWLVNLKKFILDNYKVSFEDLSTDVPVKYNVSRINLRGENLSTARGSKAKIFLSCIPGAKGSFKVRGTASMNPAEISARLDLRGLEITPFQPYFTNNVKILVTSGNVSTSGNLNLRYVGGKLAASYKGESALSNFASLDKGNGDQFLKWDSLHFGGLAVNSDPMSVQIDRIALSNFYARVIMEKNGSINLQGIFNATGNGPAAVPQPVQAASAMPEQQTSRPARMIKINTVTLQGGTINFMDRHIEPNYSANLTEIGGRISGMSSIENTTADVDLMGKLDNYAPLEITGKINPLQNKLFVDLKTDFKDMDLSTLTPYSGRHMGYTIRKGKLFLSMQYLIEKNKLDAQNHIFLDQLTLGHRVDSPVATKLPVRLAIALLKDRSGRIDLDVPVSGYINDPKFSLGGVIWEVIRNILVKAATSPFALISSIFGHGADLSYVEFNPGTAVITASEAKKLDVIEKALYDRPGLQLDIEGHADPAKDKEGLRQYTFDKEIKYQKWKETAARGEKAVSVDKINVSSKEYPKYLKLAYKAAKFPKPRNIFGFAKSLPVPEMEKLMLTHIRITGNELKELASRRAQAVKDYILKPGKIDPKRVFLLAARLGPAKEGQAGNRAELTLK